MPGWAAAAGVAMSAISTGVQAATAPGAPKQAANIQGDAANRSVDLQQQQYANTREDLTPYLVGGRGAQQSLQNAMGINYDAAGNLVDDPNALLRQKYGDFNFSLSDFNRDPSFAFRTQQGLDSIMAQGSRMGGPMSGNTLKALSDYGQQSGSQEYEAAYGRAANTYGMNSANFYGYQDEIFNRLSGMAGSGQNAALGLGSVGAQSANNIGGTMMQGANARAAGIIGSQNAQNSAFSGIGQNLQLASLMNRNGTGGAGSGNGIGQGLSNWFNGSSWNAQPDMSQMQPYQGVGTI